MQEPGEYFLKEWDFVAKKADEEMPLGVKTDEPHWVFYDNEEMRTRALFELLAEDRQNNTCRSAEARKCRSGQKEASPKPKS
jgi:hypothetical protein